MTETTTIPGVSVIIPTYNSGRFVTQAIDSALAQTVLPLEILVVDDGSSDDTRERVAVYDGRVRYLFQSNQGVAAARNLGIREAHGQLIAFLDADDVWHPRKLELQLPFFEASPTLGLLGTACYDWPSQPHPVLGSVENLKPQAISWKQLVLRNRLITSSILVRRSVLEAAGPFDQQLRGPEDHDLWLRVSELAPVANLDLPLIGYREVEGSLSKHAAMMEVGMRTILEKLDKRSVWRGRWLMRRKSYSYCYYSVAHIYRQSGMDGKTFQSLMRSLVWYPLPYRRDEVRIPLIRLKMLILLVIDVMSGRNRRSSHVVVTGNPIEVAK